MGTKKKRIITLWGLENTFKQRHVPIHKPPTMTLYVCMYVCVCVYVCMYVCVCVCVCV